ncbi:hypothetical protein OUZ56_025844 [Daphnia magna]|uniref:Uncharacterized protein n=1 Tax=Daphnia magna TaxID=35525 RepID=A0ABQ9ZKB2_9CRUS|nr:hypothetical protein OUZ56_025844 [Daphnia magna]
MPDKNSQQRDHHVVTAREVSTRIPLLTPNVAGWLDETIKITLNFAGRYFNTTFFSLGFAPNCRSLLSSRSFCAKTPRHLAVRDTTGRSATLANINQVFPGLAVVTLGCERSRVQFPDEPTVSVVLGDVAQMVERSLSMREVRGSIPCISSRFTHSIMASGCNKAAKVFSNSDGNFSSNLRLRLYTDD